MHWAPFHVRLLGAMSSLVQRHGLALAGTHALWAHGLPALAPPAGIGLVTVLETPLADVGGELVRALLAEGLRASIVEASPRACRLTAEDVTTGERCEITLARETLREPPVTREGHPAKVVTLSDLAGMRTRDLHERGLPADVKDTAALAGTFSFRELEQLAAA
ncbi:MAG: hypothetical protein HOY71_13615, partial [Nonomuraea sp.]|nr:hypothetical protein [Nonomuraea sp.]